MALFASQDSSPSSLVRLVVGTFVLYLHDLGVIKHQFFIVATLCVACGASLGASLRLCGVVGGYREEFSVGKRRR